MKPELANKEAQHVYGQRKVQDQGLSGKNSSYLQTYLVLFVLNEMMVSHWFFPIKIQMQ